MRSGNLARVHAQAHEQLCESKCLPGFERDEFRAATASIVRKTPDFDFTLTVGYDLIRDETTFGVRLAVPQTPGIGFPAY